mmetsp:Transcript_28951/g.42528  ORF Transcript_28951/g.42528 Transcript_28951/m.42528 type:complete len:93 (-) Transcript_28951:477-755(-)
MVYISPDGGVNSRRSPWRLSIISDFFKETIHVVLLFFRTMTQGTDAIRDRRVTTYGERHSANNTRRGGNRRPGSNIRGVSNLGTANNSLGGG